MVAPLLIAQIAGTALQAYGQYSAGKQQERAYEYNAMLATQQALLAEQTAVFEEELTREEVGYETGQTIENVEFKTNQILETMGFDIDQIYEDTEFNVDQLMAAAGFDIDQIEDEMAFRTGMTMKRAGIEERRKRREGERIKAKQRAQIGKSGLTPDTFMPVLMDTAREVELDALMIRYGGAEEVAKLLFAGGQAIQKLNQRTGAQVEGLEHTAGLRAAEVRQRGVSDIQAARMVGQQQIEDLGFRGGREIRLSRYQAALRATGAQSESQMLSYKADAAKTAGFLNTASTLLTGAGKIAEKWPKKKLTLEDRIQKNIGGGSMVP